MTYDVGNMLLYIHPTVMLIGYVLIVLCFALLFIERRRQMPVGFTKKSLYLAWCFTFLGLTTGMIWAAFAWGSYWSWDPKETTTLVLFLLISGAAILYEKRRNLAYFLLIQCLLFILIDVLITLSSIGLHAHG
jgi:cytochrome c biogenesis factor